MSFAVKRSFQGREKGCIFSSYLFLLLLFASFIGGSGTRDFFEQWQERLRGVRDEITSRLGSADVRDCACSHHKCGQGTDQNSQCVKSNHDKKLYCGPKTCGHAKVNLKQSYVVTPEALAFGTFPTNAKRDICLTEGLEEAFKEARQYEEGFEYWTYFGAAETGVSRTWPGAPRRTANGSQGCDPYDPRLRPWWGPAAWKPRHIIIMVDISISMNLPANGGSITRWGVAYNMTSQLLETLTTRDMVNIIVFDSSAKVLIGGNETFPATSAHVNELKKKLGQQNRVSRAQADIGEALGYAFAIVQNITKDTADNRRICENHIVLLADSRDCTESATDNCFLRDAYGRTNWSVVSNATEMLLDFAEKQQEETNKRYNTKVILFSYALAPDANGMMKQLACKLDGIHVDVQRLLEQEILDPLTLMSSYFRRAALPIANSIDGKEMVVSAIYTDAAGLGELNTFAMPVFYQANSKCPKLFYGVIGADISKTEYTDNGIDYERTAFELSRNNWNSPITQCTSPKEPNRCKLQALRGEDAQCIYRVEHDGVENCYKYNNSFYLLLEGRGQLLEQARTFCKDKGGDLIAPKTTEERHFLSHIIPPDRVWVDLTHENSEWYWPGNVKLDDEQTKNLERTRTLYANPAAYMDPRSLDDNIQSIQETAMAFTVCKFDSQPRKDVCPRRKIKEVTKANFTYTIEHCEVEDCTFEKIPGFHKDTLNEGKVICNAKPVTTTYESRACCEASELNGVCGSEEESTSDDGDNSVALVAAFGGVALLVLLIFVAICVCRMSPYKWNIVGNSGGRLLTGSPDKAVELSKKSPGYPTGRSPFTEDAAENLMIGKRPELVVNIEVKLLDNGWEKVGGYGRVRQGEYTDSSGNVHKVAVKFVDVLAPNAAWEALKNEFDILASIPLHPNIVRPIGAHYGDRSEKSQRYIVEELMHTNLGDLIHGECERACPNITITYKHLIQIFMDIASGLEHLHKHKIVHFDLKPKNVLLTETLKAKIADFGCSKAKYDTYIALSQMGGTPPYMPPECWMLQYSQNHRAEVARNKIDIYSFGVVMWECLNGGHSMGSIYSQTNTASVSSPVHEEIKGEANSAEVMVQRWEIKYQLSTSIPETLRTLVNSCVRADFDARPTCLAILDTLRPMMDSDWANTPISLG